VILAKLGVGFLCVTVTAGSVALSEGLVHVSVHQKAADGTHLSLVVPGVLAPIALYWVPRSHLQQAGGQLRPWMPAIRAAVEADQHVKVSKIGGAVNVDVDDPNETVHVSTPLRAIGSTLEELGSKADPQATQ